jgi:hypothetical protein
MGMGHDDVVEQLLSQMGGFLAESALVHAHAAAARLDSFVESNVVAVDFGTSSARPRAGVEALASSGH